MATAAHRLIQDQNLNILYNGATPGPKKTDVPKKDKRGGLDGRKALNDISNSRKPSGLPSVKKENPIKVISTEKEPLAVKAKFSKAPEKGKVGGRKALGDLTNSVKPPSKQVPSMGRKMNAIAEENVPSSIAEERFLHNHQACVTPQMKAVDMDYFLKSVGLNNDIHMRPSPPRKALQSTTKKLKSNMKHLEMEEMTEHLFEDQVPWCSKPELRGYCTPVCRSPQSPRSPYMKWEENFSDLMMIRTPELLI